MHRHGRTIFMRIVTRRSQHHRRFSIVNNTITCNKNYAIGPDKQKPHQICRLPHRNRMSRVNVHALRGERTIRIILEYLLALMAILYLTISVLPESYPAYPKSMQTFDDFKRETASQHSNF